MYSKGDTIELQDGKIVLVLEDGIKGKKFLEQYNGQTITLMSLASSVGTTRDFFVTFACVYRQGVDEQYVWYKILLGDEHIWATCFNLETRIAGDSA